MSFEPFQHPVFTQIQSKRFILASSSPRRIEILQQMGFQNIEVMPSNFPEDLKKEEYTPSEYVEKTALGKGLYVYEELKAKGESDNVIVLSADTVVELQGEIFEKPQDKADQLRNLQHFRDCGLPLQVLTAVVVINSKGKPESFVEKTKIYFDEDLTNEFLKGYVETNEGEGVAAGFRVQLRGALMMKRIDGDYYNCVGLPFRNTFKLIEKVLALEE